MFWCEPVHVPHSLSCGKELRAIQQEESALMKTHCLTRTPLPAMWSVGLVVALLCTLGAASPAAAAVRGTPIRASSVTPTATPPTINGNIDDIVNFLPQVLSEK